MTWSFRLARIAGIDVHVHVTFLMIVAWIGLLHWNQSQSLAAVAEGVRTSSPCSRAWWRTSTPRAHGSTLRHPHARHHPAADRRRGALERMPEQPAQELWVALAGPAVNVVIATALFGWLLATGWQDGESLGITSGGLVPRVMVANVFLVAFNLLPAFPMDGGRALRALLATRLDYAEATQLAASIGQGMAMLFGFLGLFGNPFLIFIALFVWIGAGQEASAVQMKSALAGVAVRGAMLTDFRTLGPEQTLGDAVDQLLAGSQQDFPVVEHGAVAGMLTRADLIAALGAAGRDAPIGPHLRRGCPSAEADELLEPVLARLQGHACHTLPVLDQGQLVGLVTMENVGELLLVQSAEKKRVPAGRRS